MARRTKSLDPIGRMPNLNAATKALSYIGNGPALDTPTSIGYMEHDKANPSSHPKKGNPGGPMRYYGGDA